MAPLLPSASSGTPNHDCSDSTGSDRRAISLTTVVATSPTPLMFSEIVERSGLPKAKAFRLLTALQRGGLVERDTDGRYHPGWLLHSLRHTEASYLRRELTADDEFLAFLSERLTEEIIAATQRRTTRGSGHSLPLLHELLMDLRRGELPDDTTLQLLTQAYAAHPQFDPAWRRPATYAARLAHREG